MGLEVSPSNCHKSTYLNEEPNDTTRSITRVSLNYEYSVTKIIAEIAIGFLLESTSNNPKMVRDSHA